MPNALDLISQITATVEPGYRIEDRMREYGLDPKRATIRNCAILEYRGDVSLSDKNLTKIPFHFVKVTGGFWCHQNHLTSLAGCPKYVSGSFSCSHNQLTSLIGGPEKVYGNFFCTNNNLADLSDCPKYVGGNFYCLDNPGSASASFKKPKGVKGYFIAY